MSIFDYYKILNKPYFALPPEVFGIVWPILYILMAVSFILVALSTNSNNKTFALILFVIQLIINLSWTKIFFVDKNLEAAFFTCLILTVLATIMTVLFFKQSSLAGLLQVPYCLWLTYATFLSYQILVMN